MQISLTNQLTAIAPAIEALEAWCQREGLKRPVAQAAELVLDELLTNIVSYGYPEGDKDQVDIHLEVRGDSLEIRLSDGGVAFNPFDHEAFFRGKSLEERKPGGVGIHLVSELMNDYAYEREGDRNVVTLLKRMEPAAGDSSVQWLR